MGGFRSKGPAAPLKTQGRDRPTSTQLPPNTGTRGQTPEPGRVGGSRKSGGPRAPVPHHNKNHTKAVTQRRKSDLSQISRNRQNRKSPSVHINLSRLRNTRSYFESVAVAPSLPSHSLRGFARPAPTVLHEHTVTLLLSLPKDNHVAKV